MHKRAESDADKRTMRSHRPPRSERDRGAVLVEAALAIPLLMFVILGAFEFGIGWETRAATSSAIRTALLQASAEPDNPDTDLRILQSVIGEIGAGNANQINWVIIYDASANMGDQAMTIDACAMTVGGAGGRAGECVAYSPALIQQVATATDTMAIEAMLSNSATCTTSAIDRHFCATSRTFDAMTGDRRDIQIGVALQYQHQWLTGILPFDAPLFHESQSSSTFRVDGVTITPNANITGPGTAVAIENFASGVPADVTGGGAVGVDTDGDGMDDAFYLEPATSTIAGPRHGQNTTISVDVGTQSVVCIELDLILFGGWDTGTSDEIEIELAQTGETATFKNFTADGNTSDGTLGGMQGHADSIPRTCFQVMGNGPTVDLVITSNTSQPSETFGINNYRTETAN